MPQQQDNLPLFDELPEPPGGRTTLTRALGATGNAGLSKAQHAFRRMVDKVERRREELRQWEAFRVSNASRVARELAPLQAEVIQEQQRMVQLMDEILGQPMPGLKLSRLQRAKLTRMLTDLIADLLASGESLAPAVEAIHDKYSPVTLAETRAMDRELTEALLQDMGVEMGPEHAALNDEELMNHFVNQMHEHAAHGNAARGQQHQQGKRSKKQSAASKAKAEAAQAQRERAEQAVSQSLREVYRKLASALHPDREPDAVARERKSRQMQRVNDAYAAKDLLTLLGLQLEIEQIDTRHLADVSEQRLAHFNQILKEQLVELESELDECIAPYRQILGRMHPTAAQVDQHLSMDIASVRRLLAQLRADQIDLRNPPRLRKILAAYKLEEDQDADFLFADDDEMDAADLHAFLDVLGAMAQQTPQPARRAAGRKKAKHK